MGAMAVKGTATVHMGGSEARLGIDSREHAPTLHLWKLVFCKSGLTRK